MCCNIPLGLFLTTGRLRHPHTMPLDRSKSLVDQLQVRAGVASAKLGLICSCGLALIVMTAPALSSGARSRGTGRGLRWRRATGAERSRRCWAGAAPPGLVTHIDGQVDGVTPTVQGCVIVSRSLSPNPRSLKRLNVLRSHLLQAAANRCGYAPAVAVTRQGVRCGVI